MAQELVSDVDSFGARLALALNASNMSRSQLSASLNVDKSVISRWLSGQVRPSSHNIARVSTLIAKMRPGFNMTLWTAPRPEFEAALGLTSLRLPAAFGEPATPPETAAPLPNTLERRSALHFGFFPAALIVLLGAAAGAWLWTRSDHAAAPSVSAAGVSVAVLPFVNMSGDPAKEYLGDGIAEEILNDLSNIPNLRVTARTSSFSFKGKSADIGEIARKLHVTAILEGSVRQQKDRIRIVAQLINPADGFHVWSATYDRTLGDTFAVQDEIAGAIAAVLNKKLAPAYGRHGKTAHGPINPTAYTAYLQGRFFINKRDMNDMQRAADLFRQAITFDPGYADAHASIAMTYDLLFSNGQRRDAFDAAKAEAAIALRLDPNNFIALLTRAHLSFTWDFSEADTAMKRLLKLHPNSAEAHHYYGDFLGGLNLWEKALAEHRRAAQLDPLSPANQDNAGVALHFLRRDKEAIAQYSQALTLETNFEPSLGNNCVSYADTGRLADAKRILREQLIPLYGKDPVTLQCAALIAYREQDKHELKRLSGLASQSYISGSTSASWIAYPYAFEGDFDNAVTWLERAYADRDYTLLYVIDDPDLPIAIRKTARWHALMNRPIFLEIERIGAQIIARDAAE